MHFNKFQIVFFAQNNYIGTLETKHGSDHFHFMSKILVYNKGSMDKWVELKRSLALVKRYIYIKKKWKS